MCGIFGSFNLDGTPQLDQRIVQQMGECLKHRGPDQAGDLQTQAISLGHRRLSIIDLSEAGRQPMPNEDETLWIVFNGEIYNYQELRAELEKRGHRFRSQTDTEVILHLFESEGEACVQRLRGMFALAIWNSRNESLFLVRDRLGKKPLYYFADSRVLAFASELKALLLHPRVSRDIAPAAIDAYLSYQYIPAPLTIFNGIQKLPPAHFLTCQRGALRIKKYWEPDFTHKIVYPSETELESGILSHLEEATRIRLKSDVPLGAFLSGGIDSSAVVAMMAKNMSAPVKTFSIGFQEDDYSELQYARRIANLFHTEHHEFIVKPDAVGILPSLVWHYDEPYSDSSALPTYYLSQMTREHVSVALTGDGGDEAFAGYEKYLAMRLYRLLNLLPGRARRCLQKMGEMLPEQVETRNLLRKFKRFLRTSTGQFSLDYLGLMTLFDQQSKLSLYSPGFVQSLKMVPSADSFLKHVIEQESDLHWIDRVARTDYLTYLPFDLLVKSDIASMAHALELRSPFLDHQVVEFAASLPANLKLKGTSLKHLLKRSLAKSLPSDILHRQKMGFGVPLNHWFRGPLQNFARETLLSEKSLGRGYFEPKQINQLVSEHADGKKDHAYKIWNLLVLEVWHQVFVDRSVSTMKPAETHLATVMRPGRS
ncbi:MAG: asparagine synthase (glutamine-hydrolyzing) [Terriglobia bacterium]